MNEKKRTNPSHIRQLPPIDIAVRNIAAKAKVSDAFQAMRIPPPWYVSFTEGTPYEAVHQHADFWLETTTGRYALKIVPTVNVRNRFVEKYCPDKNRIVVLVIREKVGVSEVIPLIERVLKLD